MKNQENQVSESTSFEIYKSFSHEKLKLLIAFMNYLDHRRPESCLEAQQTHANGRAY